MDNILGLLFSKLGMLLGLIAVMAVSYAYFQGNKSSTAISDLAQVSQGIQTLYGGNQFTSLNNTVVTNGKLAPPDMTTGTGILVNPWNGSVTLAVDPANASQFQATETSVPPDGCAKLAQGMTYASVTINGTAITLPADPGQVTTACAASNLATMTLVFSH
jgi:hypothetical protein